MVYALPLILRGGSVALLLRPQLDPLVLEELAAGPVVFGAGLESPPAAHQTQVLFVELGILTKSKIFPHKFRSCYLLRGKFLPV